MFRMMALAVDGVVRGQGLATEAMARMKAELLLVAGPRFELRADLASCMKKGGARFYASQGWTGGGGIWSWRSEASEVEGALRLLASGEALEQMLQACEQDMSATDEALSDLRGVGRLTGKRKRGDELAHQPVRHSLWEQDSLEALNEVLFGCLDGEVEALQQRKAVYDEERRLSDGSDSCWSCSGSDSGSVAELEVGSEPLALEGAVVVVTLGEGGGSSQRAGSKRKREDELTQQPVRHSLWEQGSLEACNEWLFGYLDGEVEALQQRKAVYDEERRLSEGSDSCWSDAGSDSDSEAELEVGSRPPALEGAVVVAAQEGEQVGLGLGPLQPDGKAPAVLRKRVQREENPLHPKGLAPKRMRDLVTGQEGQGKQQQRRGAEDEGELSRGIKAMASGACQGSVWILVVQCRLLATTQ